MSDFELMKPVIVIEAQGLETLSTNVATTALLVTLENATSSVPLIDQTSNYKPNSSTNEIKLSKKEVLRDVMICKRAKFRHQQDISSVTATASDDSTVIIPSSETVIEDIALNGDEKVPKHTVAIMFGYAGTKYQGLQINPGKFVGLLF